MKPRQKRGSKSSEAISSARVRAEKSRAPENSVLFEKIIPVLLVLMGILMLALVLFAAGVLLGIVHF